MPYTTLNLAALDAKLAQRLDQSAYWTADERRRALNEALRDWNLLTGRWRRKVTLSTAAGDPEVALGATMTYGMRVVLSTGAPLHPTSTLELDLGRPTWRRETTATGGDVPAAPLLWAPQSLQRIVIWPATVGVGVNNLLVDGVSATPILTEAGDTIDMGEEVVRVILDYILHLLPFKEGGPRWRATLPAFTAFLQAAAEENGLLKQNQAYRRAAGLDRRRDLQPSKGAPNQIATILQTAAQPGGGQ